MPLYFGSKNQVVMVCLQKTCTHLKCSHCVKLSFGIFFFWFTVRLYVAAQECEYNEALLHLGSCYTMLLNNLPFMPPFICCSQIVLVLFSFNWELILILPLEMIKKPTYKLVFPQASVLSLSRFLKSGLELALFAEGEYF